MYSVTLTKCNVSEGGKREESKSREVSEQKAILAWEGYVAECARL